MIAALADAMLGCAVPSKSADGRDLSAAVGGVSADRYQGCAGTI